MQAAMTRISYYKKAKEKKYKSPAVPGFFITG
jgi:hypothetical protein